MVIYADTSFLFSLYGNDANSPQARTIGDTLKVPLLFTPLHRHELRNAFRLAVFRKVLTPARCQAVLAEIEVDTRAGVLAETPIAWGEVFAEAEALSAAHTVVIGTRATDVLHVAAATSLGVTQFLTFDVKQRALARKAGLQASP